MYSGNLASSAKEMSSLKESLANESAKPTVKAEPVDRGNEEYYEDDDDSEVSSDEMCLEAKEVVNYTSDESSSDDDDDDFREDGEDSDYGGRKGNFGNYMYYSFLKVIGFENQISSWPLKSLKMVQKWDKPCLSLYLESFLSCLSSDNSQGLFLTYCLNFVFVQETILEYFCNKGRIIVGRRNYCVGMGIIVGKGYYMKKLGNQSWLVPSFL